MKFLVFNFRKFNSGHRESKRQNIWRHIAEGVRRSQRKRTPVFPVLRISSAYDKIIEWPSPSKQGTPRKKGRGGKGTQCKACRRNGEATYYRVPRRGLDGERTHCKAPGGDGAGKEHIAKHPGGDGAGKEHIAKHPGGDGAGRVD